MGVTPKGFLPRDDLSLVFNDHLAFGDVNQSKDAFTVNARLAGLNAFGGLLGVGCCGQVGHPFQKNAFVVKYRL